MTLVKCVFEACSNYALGICGAKEVELGDPSEKEDEEVIGKYLDCKSFKWKKGGEFGNSNS